MRWVRIIKSKEVKTVEYLEENKPYLDFVDESQDVEFIKEYLGGIADNYESFFVSVKEGDYVEVWGLESSVPDLFQEVTRLI